MEIIELEEGDRPRVIDLWRRAELVRPWNDPEIDYNQALATPSATVLGAIDDGALVGTVMVGFDGHRGWLYYAAVDPASQRQGVGSALVRAAEDWLAQRGARKTQLMVRSGNVPASLFYEAMEYERSDVTVWQRWL